ncbi:MAG: Crp/Fnr family transcriptional regulator [Bacteroidales bacterium]
MSKYRNLIQFISKYVSYNIEEFNEVITQFDIRTIKKGEVLIAEGEIARIIVFTNKGYLRVYYNHDGEEITRDITPLNSFATALPSFITQTPSYEVISAITDCELFVIRKETLDYLYDTHPKWERLGRRVIEDMFVETQHRLYQFITQTAEVRYKQLMQNHPDMIRDVPLKHIADFLGIKLQSLSRLRKNIEW